VVRKVVPQLKEAPEEVMKAGLLLQVEAETLPVLVTQEVPSQLPAA
jgi:hypothetical protein